MVTQKAGKVNTLSSFLKISGTDLACAYTDVHRVFFLKTGIIKKSGLRNRRRPQIETYPYKFIREKRKGIPKAFTG